MRSFEYHEPTSIDTASELLARHGREAAALAGGTALLIDIQHGELRPRHVVSLWKIPHLGELHSNGQLQIGALATVTELGNAMTTPATLGLREAARALGSWQVQNMATVGGNLCKASPGADLVPPLLCLDAQLVLRSASGERQSPLDGFLTGPDQTALEAGELLTQIVVAPPPPRTGTAFLKIMRRQALDCSIVSVCARVSLEDDGLTCRQARLGLAAVAPNPIRARQAEAELEGKRLDPETIARASQRARSEARPITDVRASAAYRSHLIGVLLERAIERAAQRAREGMGVR
jgi:carbon-monoxide dehydrogenase medium subunit